MKLKIKSVDMDGYLGRDYHPARTDVGLVGTVIGCEVWGYDGSHGEPGEPLDGQPLVVNGQPTDVVKAGDVSVDDLEYVWTVLIGQRILQLMGHEVEVAE
jgi:hypothetical protein